MIGGQLLQGLGNRQGPNTNVAMPPDIRQPRQNQLGMLDYLLGGQAGAQGQAGSPLGRLQSVFGDFSMPQTDLQRQGAGNMTSMLNANAPGSAMNVLQGMMTGTGPQFERDIAGGNQQGARFGSANEILRGEALRNLFNMRTQTAGAMGALNQQGFGMGQQQAQQADVQTQRVLQLLGGLLGLRQQATMELPITQTPNTAQAVGGGLSNIAALLPFLSMLGGSGGGGGGGGTQTFNPTGMQLPGA